MASFRAPTGNGVERGDKPGARAVRLLRLPTDDTTLIEDLAGDGAFAIEPIAGDSGYAALTGRFAEEKLIVSVSTETAFRCALSQAVATALARRLNMPEDALGDIEIAMQEAIGNAVLHGNLGLPALNGSDPEALETRIREIQKRLEDAKLVRRRVTIACDWDDESISLTVYDEGTGFSATPTPDDEAPPGAPPHRPSGGGRGLKMIRRLAKTLEIDAKNSCVRMTFPLNARTPVHPERA